MPMLNVVNPEAVDRFLCDLAEGDMHLLALLRPCLTRPLLREEGALAKLSRRPPRSPAWLSAQRFAEGGPFYRFSVDKLAGDPQLREAVLAVKHWLQDAISAQHGWVRVENGCPLSARFRNIGCLQHVMDLIAKDTRRARARGVLPKPPPMDDDTAIVLDLPHGWQWRRLLTPDALRQEGLMMRNCLSTNARCGANVLLGGYQYYSLRDITGQAHVTLEVREGVVTQKRGRGNSTPAARYRGAITALLQAKGWTVITPFPERWGMPQSFHEDPFYTGAVEVIEGSLDARFFTRSTRVPYVLRLSGTLDLRRATDLRVLPRVLSVGGDVLLGGATNLEQMPDWLWVAGDLNMQGCRRVKTLGAQTAVRGSFCLSDCAGLQRLPLRMRVGRTLDLRGCNQLTWMSQHILVLGEILIGDTRCTTAEAAHCLLDARARDRR